MSADRKAVGQIDLPPCLLIGTHSECQPIGKPLARSTTMCEIAISQQHAVSADRKAVGQIDLAACPSAVLAYRVSADRKAVGQIDKGLCRR